LSTEFLQNRGGIARIGRLWLQTAGFGEPSASGVRRLDVQFPGMPTPRYQDPGTE